MQEENGPRFEYDPPHQTHFLAKIAMGLIALVIVVAIVSLIKKKNEQSARQKGGRAVNDLLPREVGKKQLLTARFFDVGIDSVTFTDRVTEKGELILPQAEKEDHYIILFIHFKNTDTESRMIPDGELTIESGNTEMKYDDPEVTNRDGWGTLMGNIDPGITMMTRIVYKIPASMTGRLYYYPDISYSNDRIFLGGL